MGDYKDRTKGGTGRDDAYREPKAKGRTGKDADELDDIAGAGDENLDDVAEGSPDVEFDEVAGAGEADADDVDPNRRGKKF